MIIRDFAAQIKAVGKDDGLKEGQFEALVSTFGNVDSYGDRVVKGAFADDVEAWKDGVPLPIVWSHKWDDAFAHIGVHDEVDETDRGLRVLATNDLDNPTAAQAQRHLKARRIRQFSFAYDIIDGAPVEETVKTEGGEDIKRSVFELRKLKTFEVGPCLVGVNQETELLGAKAASLAMGVLGGRRLDVGSVERLKSAVAALREVITLSSKTVEPPEADDEQKDYADSEAGTSQNDETPADDDPAAGKSDKATPEIARRSLAVELMFLD